VLIKETSDPESTSALKGFESEEVSRVAVTNNLGRDMLNDVVVFTTAQSDVPSLGWEAVLKLEPPKLELWSLPVCLA